jgi:hypothetical protein
VRAALRCLSVLACACAVACACVGGARLMGALPFPAGVVAVAGSRSLPPKVCAVVAAVARELVTGGCSLVCGCCVGADAAVLAALAGTGGCAAGAPLRVLCAWGPGGAPARVPPRRWVRCSRLQGRVCL